MKQLTLIAALLVLFTGCRVLHKTTSKKQSQKTEKKTSQKDSIAASVVTKTNETLKADNIDVSISFPGQVTPWKDTGKIKGPVAELIKTAGQIAANTGGTVRLIIGGLAYDLNTEINSRQTATKAKEAIEVKQAEKEVVKTKEVKGIDPVYKFYAGIILLILLAAFTLDAVGNNFSFTKTILKFFRLWKSI